MRGAILQFLLSGAAVLVSGVVLTRCADALAAATGLGRSLAGMLLLATATSLPELSVGLASVGRGRPDLAAGDLLGSSLINLLILAALDAAGLSRDKALGPDSRPHVPKALFAAGLTAWVGLALASGAKGELLGVGWFSWGLLPLFVAGLSFVKGPPERPEKPRFGWRAAAAGYAAGAGGILWAAPRLADAAASIAESTGLGHTFVGSTLLALCTGLPELASVATAFRMGAPELAVAAIFGSNAFNMTIFLPFDLAHEGPLFPALDRAHLLTAFAVLGATNAVALASLARSREPRRYLDPAACGVTLLLLGLLRLLASAS